MIEWIVIGLLFLLIMRLAQQFSKVMTILKRQEQVMLTMATEIGTLKKTVNVTHDKALKAHAQGITEVTGYYTDLLRQNIERGQP